MSASCQIRETEEVNTPRKGKKFTWSLTFKLIHVNILDFRQEGKKEKRKEEREGEVIKEKGENKEKEKQKTERRREEGEA